MTTTPHGQVPEALRLVEQYNHGDPAAHGNAWKAAVCTELLRLHAYCQELESQVIRDCMTHVQEPAEIEHVAGDVSKNGAEVNMNVYAELPQSVGDHKYGGGLYTDAQMLAFADATHALRTQQPAPAGSTEEVENLRKALVYAAFALHDTPQYMLAQGIALIDGDTVRVSRDGWTVEASVNPHRQTAPATQQAGWRLVPIEPTQAMLDAMQSGGWMVGNYRDMLAAAPQQEAQEPAAVVVPCHTPSGKRVALYSAKQDLPIGTKLYTGPQPSPTPQPAPATQQAGEVVPLDVALHAVEYLGMHNSASRETEMVQMLHKAAQPSPTAQAAESVLEDAALSGDQQRAIFEAYESAASEGYFEARPQIDCNDRRRVFKAGYERGWDAARKQGGAT